MAGPPHHFMQNMNNQQKGPMQNSFGPGPMQTPNMQNQMTPMPVQMNNPLGSPIINPMGNTLGPQMSPAMSNSNQLMGQMNQYNMNSNAAQMGPHPQQNQMPMLTRRPMGNMEYTGAMQHHEMSQQAPVAPTPPVQQAQQVQQQQAQQQQQQQQVQQQQQQAAQQQQQSKEFNTASLCRLGQETVQDIVSRTQEVFQTLKSIQPPNGTTAQSLNQSNEKKAKVQELLRTIRVLFKRLRLIYEKCNENCQIQGMEYTHIESLIPFKDELDPKHDEKKNSEAYRHACEESKEVMEQVVLKNKQLKEVIDHLRRIIWEINTMLSMRRS